MDDPAGRPYRTVVRGERGWARPELITGCYVRNETAAAYNKVAENERGWWDGQREGGGRGCDI
jgi:hypothetical protein